MAEIRPHTPQIRGSFWGRDGAILNPDHLGSHAGVLLLSIPPWLQAQLPVGPRCPSLGQPPGVDADAAQHLLNEVTQLRGDDEDVGGDGQRGEAGEALVVHIHLLCRGVQGVEAALRQDVLEDPCEPIRGPRGAADLLGAHMEEEVGGGEAQHDPIDVQGAGIWHEVHPRFVLLGQLRADEGGLGVHEVVVGVPLGGHEDQVGASTPRPVQQRPHAQPEQLCEGQQKAAALYLFVFGVDERPELQRNGGEKRGKLGKKPKPEILSPLRRGIWGRLKGKIGSVGKKNPTSYIRIPLKMGVWGRLKVKSELW